MSRHLRLASIPGDKYSGYRYDVIFKAYKWDPQVGDHNTISRHAVLMSVETAEQLETWAEQMSRETVSMEEALLKRMPLAEELRLPAPVYKAFKRLSGYDRGQNVRLMRFDFHPVETGWAVSEVNSDVPGGLAEASAMPGIAAAYFDGCSPGPSVAKSLLEAFRSRLKNGGRIAFVHATSYSDDRQVMQFLSDYFRNGRWFDTILAAPDHLRWNNKKAVSILEGREGEIDGIVRFFPLEWFAGLPRNSDWQGYYDCATPSCNHPVASLAQSKRLPLMWDKLEVDIPAWKRFLPETRDPGSVLPREADWIFKPALGRVGEGISIKGAASEKELKLIEKAVRVQPKDWVAQRMFKSLPLVADDGESYHLCIGVFTVDGKAAGFYGRLSPYPRIDARAKDVPILIAKD
jgi:glutathionylspermidine synthase